METTERIGSSRTERGVLEDARRLLKVRQAQYEARLAKYKNLPEGYGKRAEFVTLDDEHGRIEATRRTLNRRIDSYNRRVESRDTIPAA